MHTAPVVLFTFNRPVHTGLALKSLLACQGAGESDLIVYSDAARSEADAANVGRVRDLFTDLRGFRTVRLVARKSNHGAARNVADGVQSVLDEFGRAIFVEDDLVLSRSALKYFNRALSLYENRPSVMTVCGYSYPLSLLKIPRDYEFDVYFNPGFLPWGWATWKRALPFIDWCVRDYDAFIGSPTLVRNFDRIEANLLRLLADCQNGVSDDWVLPLTLSQFRNRFVSVAPVRSLVDNIGHDGSGLHCKRTSIFRTKAEEKAPSRFPSHVFVDELIQKRLRNVLSKAPGPLLRRKLLEVLYLADRWIRRPDPRHP